MNSQPPAGAGGSDRPSDDKASSSSAPASTSAGAANGAASNSNGDSKDAAMEVEEDEWPEDIKNASPEDLMTRVRMLDNDIRVGQSLYGQPAALQHRMYFRVSSIDADTLYLLSIRSCAPSRSA